MTAQDPYSTPSDATEVWLSALEQRLGAEATARHPSIPQRLTVLFDPECALCRRARAWMLGQSSYVELEFVPSTSSVAQARYGDLPWLGDELLVVSNDGQVWVGPAAFITCLWALVAWRPWSYRLAGSLSGVAERFFLAVSKNRGLLSGLLGHHECEDGACRVGSHRASGH
jgi:predicted DCC family thiol-disulfide oxidoreductase YuxK